MRRAIPWILVCVALAAGLWLLLPQPGEPASSATAETGRPGGSTSAPVSLDAPDQGGLVDGLNSPDGAIERDLEIVSSVFEAFRTNFPAEGNPTGENNEITAALAGRNRLGIQFIPRRHPAINLRGELVDRWGTPFFFHQIGGHEMEIRSAGPDMRLYTDDDVLLTPGSY